MSEFEEPTEAENPAESEQPTEYDLQGVEMDSGEEPEETPEELEPQEGVPSEPEQTEPKPMNQEAVNKKIDRLTFKRHEERRKREEAESRIAKMEAELNRYKKPEQGLVTVPELSDPFDSNFEIRLREREQALQHNARVTVRQQLEAKRQQEQAKIETERAQQEVMDLSTKMYSKAEKAGIAKDELQGYEQRVAMFVKSPELARFIMGHEESALIVKYLASNVTQLENISTMNPVNAAAHIVSSVVPNVNTLKPTPTKTPAPVDVPGGRGAAESESKFLEGVKFE